MHFMLTYLCSLKSSPTNGEIGHQHDGSMAQNQSGGPWCQLLGTARHSVVLNGTYVLPKRQEDKGLVVKNNRIHTNEEPYHKDYCHTGSCLQNVVRSDISYLAIGGETGGENTG